MGATTLDPNLALVIVAFLNCITAFLAWRTHQIAKNAVHTIETLEQNTNSIKDALVKKVGEAAFAAGETKARDAGIAEAKALLAEKER